MLPLTETVKMAFGLCKLMAIAVVGKGVERLDRLGLLSQRRRAQVTRALTRKIT